MDCDIVIAESQVVIDLIFQETTFLRQYKNIILKSVFMEFKDIICFFSKQVT